MTSKRDPRGGVRRALPYAFTEQGVAMLSIHRTVLRKLVELERKVHGHDDQLAVLAEAIRELESQPGEPPKEIGFKA